MSKNVAVFVDVANIFYAAKAAGVDIDYVTLLKSATAGRDLVRAYAYTGLDPDNENQRNFHDFLRRSNYKVVSKDIRKYGDGKVKANLDIELVVDMMKTARNLDIAIVVSGDGDFAPAIRAVQEQGVRVEVISFRGNTSSDLIEVADLFTDIVQLARVEKGSRSGRRVADGDVDLSMTEVPDKQTEGTGAGRGRGGRGGRGRSRTGEATPVSAGTSRGRGRSRTTTAPTNGASAHDAEGLLALPGERLSKAVGSLTEADLAAAEVFTLDDVDERESTAEVAPDEADTRGEADATGDGTDEDAGRRRRRRGGRGRGRGRAREDGPETAVADPTVERSRTARDIDQVDEEDDVDEAPVAPRGPRSTPFGSVWDSQLGTSAAPSGANLAPIVDEDEDFDEPEIPEYLIAEQRRGSQAARGGRGGQAARGGPRGGRSAYQAAMQRERYGRGGGGGGINRYPDVSGRTGAPDRDRPERDRPARDDRGYGRRDDRPREGTARGGSAEPWSEVPPELEAMLRAQVGTKPVSRRSEPAPDAEAPTVTQASIVDATGDAAEAVSEATPKRRATTRRTTAAKPATRTASKTAANADAVSEDAATPPKRRATTRKTATVDSEVAVEATSDVAPKPATRRRTATRTAAGASAEPVASEGTDAAAAPAPKRRTRKAADSAESA